MRLMMTVLSKPPRPLCRQRKTSAMPPTAIRFSSEYLPKRVPRFDVDEDDDTKEDWDE